MSRKIIILAVAVAAVAVVAYVATRRNPETGQTALDHTVTGMEQKVDQWESDSAAEANATQAEQNFDAAASATTIGGAIGNTVEGIGNKIEQGSNEAQSTSSQKDAESNFNAAGQAVSPASGN